MLIKLIRHEFMAVGKILLPFYIMLVGIATLVRVFISMGLLEAMPIWGALLIMLSVIYLVIAAFITMIANIIRFYQNLFTDEGYLMFTLPISINQHLIAKTIIGFFWVSLYSILCVGAIAINLINMQTLEYLGDFIIHIPDILRSLYGVPWVIALVVLTISFIVSILYRLWLAYCCMSIGQLFHKHKILGAILVYFGITTAINIISVAFALFTGFATESISYYASSYHNASYYLYTYGNLLISCLLTVGFYLVTKFILQKHLNLS